MCRVQLLADGMLLQRRFCYESRRSGSCVAGGWRSKQKDKQAVRGVCSCSTTETGDERWQLFLRISSIEQMAFRHFIAMNKVTHTATTAG